jgi:hypothetical protein
MSNIISGRFQTQDEVAGAIEELERAGFPASGISSFYVNPAGQHDLYASGENDHVQRKAGMLVAVATDTAEREDAAAALLHSIHADAIERSVGTIVDGDWIDFDPLSVPHPLTSVGPGI